MPPLTHMKGLFIVVNSLLILNSDALGLNA
jgi:hypothetical protein